MAAATEYRPLVAPASAAVQRMAANSAPPALVVALGLAVCGCALGSVSAAIWGSGVRVASVLGAAAWTLVYDLALRLIYTHGGEQLRTRAHGGLDDDDPRASGCVALLHQCGTFWAIFGALALTRHSDWEAFWAGPEQGAHDMLVRHLWLSMIGYQLKDFLPGRQISLLFATHHLFVLVGCGVCLMAPAGLGLLATISVVGETGSAAYIAEWMFPGRVPLRVFYQLVMTTSNVLAALGADLFFHGQEDTVSWEIRAGYGGIVVALASMRTVGQCQQLYSWLI